MPAHEPDLDLDQDRGRSAQAPPPYPWDGPPPYPGEAVAPDRGGTAPAYPDDLPPAYPGDLPPAHPGEPSSQVGAMDLTPPVYPGSEAVASAPPEYPGAEALMRPEDPPVYPGTPAAALLATPPAPPPPAPPPPEPPPPVAPPPTAAPAGPGHPPMAPAGMPTGEPAVAAPPQPSHRPDVAPEHDDLALQSGRTHLRARQRGVDGAALSQLAVTLPTALISLFVVALVFSMINPVVGLVMTLLWLLSGFLVFHRPAEAAIARHLLGMRRPDPADAQRLDVVWEQVTRRAGVRHGTYELWIQDRTELNATAAAGHIVAVTRHALDRLTNSQLAAVLAHELGHHVGGHTWAGLLADWYALPARMVWRWTLVGLSRLLRSKNKSSMACGGCLSLILVQFLFALTFIEGMWWLVLPAAVGPLVVAGLRRRAEVRADDYATGLGFGDELVAVLEQEQRSRSTPQGAGPGPWPHPAQWIPPQPGAPTDPPSYPHAYPPPPPDGAGRAHVMPEAAHTNFEERLRQLRRNDRVTRR